MARIQAYAANWTGSGTTNTIVSGPGGIHSIIISSSSATSATVIFYDNTAASGTILLTVNINSQYPFIWHSKDIAPLRFATGLTVVSPTGCSTFVVTEQ
jgi:hypothetical protein